LPINLYPDDVEYGSGGLVNDSNAENLVITRIKNKNKSDIIKIALALYKFENEMFALK